MSCLCLHHEHPWHFVIAMHVQVATPSPSQPSLDVAAGGKPLPTAKKASQPTRHDVASVARPTSAPIAVPKVGMVPPPPAEHAPPTKRAVEAMENTQRKMSRLLAPTPSKAPPLQPPPTTSSPVARSIGPELDQVSDSKGSPRPESSLVFPIDAKAATGPPLAVFTPAPSEVSNASGQETLICLHTYSIV